MQNRDWDSNFVKHQHFGSISEPKNVKKASVLPGHQNHETGSKKVFDEFARLPLTIFTIRNTN